MNRLLCAPSVAGLLMVTADVSAKPKAKGDKVEMLFRKLDTNGDGVLSKEEFAKLPELRHKKGAEAREMGST